ncbi:MAG: hypothetical protein SOV95_03080, partial [Anaerovibrio sp.]|uniref:hypothetical protein n=1 Tax=Anaerovibrio sp. TaxID=1872532 RepID=UPI00260AE36D
MAKEFVLSAVREMKDMLTGGVKNARKSMIEINNSASATASGLRGVEKSGVSAMSSLGKSADAAGAKVKGVVRGMLNVPKNTSIGISVKDNATPKLEGLRSKLRGISGKSYDVLVNVKT